MPAEYGLIGYPLTHSFSPAYFNSKFQREGIDAIYHSFSIPDIKELPELLVAHPQLRGLNVTIPYKQTVLPYLTVLDETAMAVGAVNCIAIDDNHAIGYNTDVIGFEQSLLPLLKPHHTQALVLGTGGASKAVTFVLNKLHIPYQMVSRISSADAVSYDELTDELVASHTLIINTTPMGMHPEVEVMPRIPSAAIGAQHLLYDLVYNPEETLFLKMGRLRGATAKNGLEMLHLQAEAAWHIWHQPTV
ncbi:MAG: shikimate dehydrogenase [Sphingobacteriales bacterium]|nr:MAG: shikimate dehydrogenase [Sphingobacteriales bacterium]